MLAIHVATHLFSEYASTSRILGYIVYFEGVFSVCCNLSYFSDALCLALSFFVVSLQGMYAFCFVLFFISFFFFLLIHLFFICIILYFRILGVRVICVLCVFAYLSIKLSVSFEGVYCWGIAAHSSFSVKDEWGTCFRRGT